MSGRPQDTTRTRCGKFADRRALTGEGSEGKPTHPPTPSRHDIPTPANQGGRVS